MHWAWKEGLHTVTIFWEGEGGSVASGYIIMLLTDTNKNKTYFSIVKGQKSQLLLKVSVSFKQTRS